MGIEEPKGLQEKNISSHGGKHSFQMTDLAILHHGQTLSEVNWPCSSRFPFSTPCGTATRHDG